VVDDNDHEYIIIRQVTPSKNLYYLDDQEFGGFGREIPEEIQNILEMFVVELENSEKVDLHFFDQHDTPFMVARGSAGTRSKLLGRIAGLHTLDRGIVAVNKDIRAGNSALKTRSMDKDELQQKVDNVVDTSNSHILHDDCKTWLQEIASKLTTLNKLKELQKAHSEIVAKGKETKKLFNRLPDIVVDFQKIREDIQRRDKLVVLQSALTSFDQKIGALPIAEVDVDIDFTEVRENIQKLHSLQEYDHRLNTIDAQIKTLVSIKFDVDIGGV
ncbi:hypothetical protein LCGC14_2920350, partial [marine sediment metagenome]